MAYFTQEDLTALIPASWLTEALDDDADGSEDAFAAVQQLAEDEVNGELGRLYPVPFDTTGKPGLESFVRALCIHIAAEIVYERRGKELPESRAKKLAEMRKRLAAIGNGTEKLNPEVERGEDAIEIIGEPSKTWSTQMSA